jgi:hypothetical protein
MRVLFSIENKTQHEQAEADVWLAGLIFLVCHPSWRRIESITEYHQL